MQSKPLDVMALVPRNAARETSSSDKRVHERRIKALHVDELMIGAKIALEETVRCCACFSLDALTEIGLFHLFSPHRLLLLVLPSAPQAGDLDVRDEFTQTWRSARWRWLRRQPASRTRVPKDQAFMNRFLLVVALVAAC